MSLAAALSVIGLIGRGVVSLSSRMRFKSKNRGLGMNHSVWFRHEKMAGNKMVFPDIQ